MRSNGVQDVEHEIRKFIIEIPQSNHWQEPFQLNNLSATLAGKLSVFHEMRFLRTFALIVFAQVFCASHVSVAHASSPGPREEKCHAKVCKQIWRPRRKVKEEVEMGDSYKEVN